MKLINSLLVFFLIIQGSYAVGAVQSNDQKLEKAIVQAATASDSIQKLMSNMEKILKEMALSDKDKRKAIAQSVLLFQSIYIMKKAETNDSKKLESNDPNWQKATFRIIVSSPYLSKLIIEEAEKVLTNVPDIEEAFNDDSVLSKNDQLKIIVKSILENLEEDSSELWLERLKNNSIFATWVEERGVSKIDSIKFFNDFIISKFFSEGEALKKRKTFFLREAFGKERTPSGKRIENRSSPRYRHSKMLLLTKDEFRETDKETKILKDENVSGYNVESALTRIFMYSEWGHHTCGSFFYEYNVLTLEAAQQQQEVWVSFDRYMLGNLFPFDQVKIPVDLNSNNGSLVLSPAAWIVRIGNNYVTYVKESDHYLKYNNMSMSEEGEEVSQDDAFRVIAANISYMRYTATFSSEV